LDGRECKAQELVALWSSEAGAKSIHNGVLDIGLDNPETRGGGNSAGSVDVEIGKR